MKTKIVCSHLTSHIHTEKERERERERESERERDRDREREEERERRERGRKEMYYLTIHSTHFIYGNMEMDK